jgi:hypothetical protein
MPPKPPMMDEMMDEGPMAEAMSEATPEEMPEDTPATEPAQDGYMLAIKITPAGITVCKKPLEAEAPKEDGTDYEEVQVDSIKQALQAVLALYKQSPVGASEQAAFQSGYGEPQGGY